MKSGRPFPKCRREWWCQVRLSASNTTGWIVFASCIFTTDHGITLYIIYQVPTAFLSRFVKVARDGQPQCGKLTENSDNASFGSFFKLGTSSRHNVFPQSIRGSERFFSIPQHIECRHRSHDVRSQPKSASSRAKRPVQRRCSADLV